VRERRKIMIGQKNFLFIDQLPKIKLITYLEISNVDQLLVSHIADLDTLEYYTYERVARKPLRRRSHADFEHV
jgi:hypothetical protein